MSKGESEVGFRPGQGVPGVSESYVGQDAADCLVTGANHGHSSASGIGVLLLADGGRYEGTLFGAEAMAEGELVFTAVATWIFGSGKGEAERLLGKGGTDIPLLWGWANPAIFG